MNRREMLERIALMMGGTLSASSIAAIVMGFQPAEAATYVPQTLTPAQDELVATLAELIIPTTDTPGGRAAGVNRFIDGMLTAIYTDAERQRFLAALVDLEARAQARGAEFVASRPETQVQILKELEAEAMAVPATGTSNGTFFHELKELTLTGYYRSEIGATQEQRYVLVPGYYKGDVPVEEIGRAWSRP